MAYHRYADPLRLFDMMLEGRRFSTFVREMLRLRNDEELWDVWLHKVHTAQSFEDFRRGLAAKAAPPRATKRRVAATVKDSLDILRGFRPTTD